MKNYFESISLSEVKSCLAGFDRNSCRDIYFENCFRRKQVCREISDKELDIFLRIFQNLIQKLPRPEELGFHGAKRKV